MDPDTMSAHDDESDIHLNHYRVPRSMYVGHNGSTTRRYIGEQLNCMNNGTIPSLTELATKEVACHIPFGIVERFDPPVPEPMQCRIAFWSFPQDEEDIKLYTCLANGNADVFTRAEEAISLNCVCDMLQVGFHLSANVRSVHKSTDEQPSHQVAITFDRRRITSCSCSCSAASFWCQHAVAVCLQRIRRPHDVPLRAPVSESLQRLEKNQLQKFAQYLINELPQQILPAAQKLLDELLSGDEANINQNPAAPDPTAGATVHEHTRWCLDDTHLSVDIKKILNRQCSAQTTVCCDVQSLHQNAPPSVAEYSQLLRTIRGREPEGIWNLITIVREMMKRRDANFYLLLDIMTQEVLSCEKIITWWFETKVSLHSGSMIHLTNKPSTHISSQYTCSYFCDEIVQLWRLAAMNPDAKPAKLRQLSAKFFDWHLEILKRQESLANSINISKVAKQNKRNILDLFSGFKPAMEGCLVNWDDWDRKKHQVIESVKDPGSVNQKGKTSKSNKRKKKRSKGQKANVQATIEAENSSLETNNTSLSILEKDDIPKSSRSNDEQAYEEDPPMNIAKLRLDDRESHCEIIYPREEPVVFNSIGHVFYQEPPQLPQLPLLQPPMIHPIQNGQNPILPNQALARIERDLQVYFMERPHDRMEEIDKPEPLENLIKVNVIRLNDPLETLYAKTESLYAHGYTEEARKLAIKVSNEILTNPRYPNLQQLYSAPRRRKKKGSLDNRMSIVTSEALNKIAFLCNVLLDCPENQNLVFRLALFGIELKRSPAATKPLEVKLINQKQDLINLLKTINLREDELSLVREKANSFVDGCYIENTDALTVLILGNYIFETLVSSKIYTHSCSPCFVRPPNPNPYNSMYQIDEQYLHVNDQQGAQGADIPRLPCSIVVQGKLPTDITLGFQAALNALSAKVNFVEADHPILCEGTRRLRCDLALTLLTYYKDEDDKLDLILKYFLDPDIGYNNPSSNESTVSEVSKTPSKRTNLSTEPLRASAYVLYELAETVYDRAGGSSLTAHIFRPRVNRTIHRGLHLCSLRIALHSLGLSNKITPTWLSRNYNRRASFIHEQAIDIGIPAIRFLCDNWEGYLTPVEVAFIADKASCSVDPEMKAVAADMAKSCLRYAHVLGYNAVSRILQQCKEQRFDMVEQACLEIEKVSENGNVCASVLFAASRVWYDLYKKLMDLHKKPDDCPNLCSNESCPNRDQSWKSEEPPANGTDWQTPTKPTPDRCEFFGDIIHWDIPNVKDESRMSYMPTPKHKEYVTAAYRTGVKALNALKPPVHNSKHCPMKGDDLLILLGLSKLLGREPLLDFCKSAIENISNPHLLYLIVTDLSTFLQKLSFDHRDRRDMLIPLVEKCLERFVKKTEEVMKHYSNEQRGYVEATIEAAKFLALQTYTMSAFNLFEQLLNKLFVNNKKSVKYRPIDTTYYYAWLDDMKQIMFNCPCRECLFGQSLEAKPPRYFLDNPATD